MRKRRLIFGVSLLLGILGALAVWDIVRAQTVIGPVVDFFAVRNPGNSQRTARVDATVSPNRTELGVDAANYFRAVGAAGGSSITLSAIGTDSGITIALSPKGTTGIVTLGGEITTVRRFFDAVTYCQDYSTATTAVATRVAANDTGLRRTATAAETHNFVCSLNDFGLRTTASKGVEVTALEYVFQNTIAALTTHTVTNLATTAYVDSTANAVVGLTLSGTLATTSQSTPQVAGLTVSSPTWLTTYPAGLTLETSVVLTTNGVFTLYGIGAKYTTALY